MRRTVQSKLPESVLSLLPGTLIALPIEDRAMLFLREDQWGLKKYADRCPAELRMCTWDIDAVVLIVFLLRLARTDLTTFEFWIDAGSPGGVRVLQDLAAQPRIDVHLVTDRIARSFRLRNVVRSHVQDLLNVVRSRNAWRPEQFDAVRARICQLYPTPHTLWWSGQ